VTNLPTGLNYDLNTGAISGTPDSGTSTKSPYAIGISVTDSLMNTVPADPSPTLIINAGSTPLTITTSSLVDGTCNTKYGPVVLAATGGTAPYTWTVSNLPHGMSFNGVDTISGTPDEAGGPCNICIQLDDAAAGHAYVEPSLTVASMKGCSIWSCTITPCS